MKLKDIKLTNPYLELPKLCYNLVEPTLSAKALFYTTFYFWCNSNRTLFVAFSMMFFFIFFSISIVNDNVKNLFYGIDSFSRSNFR